MIVYQRKCRLRTGLEECTINLSVNISSQRKAGTLVLPSSQAPPALFP